jgi:2-polyprenyl-6-methoxyphenol hydroxylase-like FAD-dependent oxidoreductase
VTEHLPIAIIGGGLGGLTTAAVLHRRGIHATVLELEPHRAARTQGGMLDIHADSGQRALKAAGRHEEFLTLVHPGGESLRIRDRTGALLHSDDDEGQLERPEIERGQLRDLLLGALPDEVIRWGSKVTAVIPDDSVPDRHHIRLGDGTEYTTGLLIGADGAWSQVRPLVSGAQPVYSGISFIEADILDADARHPALAATMGPGMLFALGGDTGILGHRESDGSLHFYLGHRAGETWVDSIDFGDRTAATRAVLRLLEGWSEDLRGLIVHADREPTSPFTTRPSSPPPSPTVLTTGKPPWPRTRRTCSLVRKTPPDCPRGCSNSSSPPTPHEDSSTRSPPSARPSPDRRLSMSDRPQTGVILGREGNEK